MEKSTHQKNMEKYKAVFRPELTYGHAKVVYKLQSTTVNKSNRQAIDKHQLRQLDI